MALTQFHFIQTKFKLYQLNILNVVINKYIPISNLTCCNAGVLLSKE